MRRIHVFRAGTHAPMQGGTLDFSAADLAATARAYDPAKREAPIVVGHPKTDAPAYGWVGGLTAEAEGLFATPRQVEPAFAEMVQAGRFKKVSASFYAPDSAQNPTPGVYYLKHIGFLGAAAPAIAGLKPVEFAADEAGTVTVEFSAPSGWRLGWIFSDLATLLRGLRDDLVARDGVDAADKLLPGGTLQRIAEEAARLQAEDVAEAAPASAFAQPPAPPATTETKRVTDEELAAREKALADKEAAFAEREAVARKAEDQAFVDGLVKDAKLPQGLAPRVVAFMATLGDTGEVSFAEGGKTVTEAPRAAFRALLTALPKVVAFGEAGGGAGPAAGEPIRTADFAGHLTDPARLELHGKALAYQRAHPGTDYLAAVTAVENAG